MLLIDYDRASQAAVVSASDELPRFTWADIRRVCIDRSPQTLVVRPQLVAVPWCSFLSFRSDLTYVLRKHAINPEVTPAAARLLQAAQINEQRYWSNREAPPLDTSDIQQRLEGLGWSSARRLTPEQLRNVGTLLRLNAGATFSVPGAGKTTEALAYYLLIRPENAPLLVVGPKNAFAAWEEQVQACVPGPRNTPQRLQGGQAAIADLLARRPTVALITYQQLWRAAPQVADYLSDVPTLVFLDESHRMKRGFSGALGASVLSLAHLPTHKLVMSGTPMPNSVADLTPQFSFLFPEVSTDDESVIGHIRPIYVRTTKAELNLTPPTRRSVGVEMRPAQRRLYDALKSEAARQLENLSTRDRLQLRAFGRAVVRLLQAATDPGLLVQSGLATQNLLQDAVAEGTGSKVETACRLARDLATHGHKSIIWSQFVQIVELVADSLVDLGAEFIHGGVQADEDEENTDSREAKIRRFHDDPACMVLVANPAAAAEGISLHTVCHSAIYVDRSYNAAHYLQSEDRIHRLGLPRHQPTYVTILEATRSIDASVSRRLSAKTARMGAILNDPGLNIEPVSIDDDFDLDSDDIEDIRLSLLG
jgi:SNF2 family DNA or RNA helicase